MLGAAASSEMAKVSAWTGQSWGAHRQSTPGWDAALEGTKEAGAMASLGAARLVDGMPGQGLAPDQAWPGRSDTTIAALPRPSRSGSPAPGARR